MVTRFGAEMTGGPPPAPPLQANSNRRRRRPSGRGRGRGRGSITDGTAPRPNDVPERPPPLPDIAPDDVEMEGGEE